MSDLDAAPETEEERRRPPSVVAAAVICFVEAGFCGLVVLAGIVITVLGAEAHAAGTDAGLLITIGILIAAFFLVVGAVYLLGAAGLLRGDRLWYFVVVTLLAISVVAGVIAFAVQRNLWDLFWPLVDAVTMGLLTGTPGSRAYFARPDPQAAGAGSSSS